MRIGVIPPPSRATILRMRWSSSPARPPTLSSIIFMTAARPRSRAGWSSPARDAVSAGPSSTLIVTCSRPVTSAWIWRQRGLRRRRRRRAPRRRHAHRVQDLERVAQAVGDAFQDGAGQVALSWRGSARSRRRGRSGRVGGPLAGEVREEEEPFAARLGGGGASGQSTGGR